MLQIARGEDPFLRGLTFDQRSNTTTRGEQGQAGATSVKNSPTSGKRQKM